MIGGVVQRKPFAGGHREFIDALLAGTIRAERLVGAPGALQFDDPEAPDVVAVGGIYQTMSSVNPGAAVAAGGLGYGIWALIADGRVLVGTTTAANVESGAATATPAGACSAPVFTGTPLLGHSHSFTGTPAATSLVSAGTPSGSCSAPTFTGAALATHTHGFTGTPLAGHAHELPLQLVSGTSTRHLPAATFGTGTSRAAQGADTATANTTSAAVALSQAVSAGTPAGTNASVSAGTPSGTVSAPTFTGSALATHQHALTATGANSSDSAGTPAGTVSAPTFTGAPLALQPPSLSCFTWVRTG